MTTRPIMVMDAETSRPVSGRPSAELVRESLASTTGVVRAYRDESGLWQHVRESDASLLRIRGEQVRSVYVSDAARAK